MLVFVKFQYLLQILWIYCSQRKRAFYLIRMKNNIDISNCQDLKHRSVNGIYKIDIKNGWKICYQCNKKKNLIFFSKDVSHGNPIYRKLCKDCRNKNKRIPEHLKKHNRKPRQNTDFKRGYKTCGKCKQSKNLNNFHFKNKEKKWYRSQCKKCVYKIFKNKKEKNINFRTLISLRDRTRNILSGIKKSDSTINLLGCSIADFRKYIKNLFKDNMSWENYGRYGWHIDHILPCELFDLTDPKQQKICFNYKNLQPLWHSDNMNKSDYLLNGRRASNLTPQEKLDYLKSLGYNL